jgi:EF-P beta-lysylation protein EpmB
MVHGMNRAAAHGEKDWVRELANSLSDPGELFRQLEIPNRDWPMARAGSAGLDTRPFPLKVPHSFVQRMETGNIHDPLLRQVLPLNEESEIAHGYSPDPLGEHSTGQPGLLHKYRNRAVLTVKSGCAIHCRYCFRRHFPYAENNGSLSAWQSGLAYIRAHTELNELILSGGDPLMATDNELEWLIAEIGTISHIKRLRIHSRLPVVIPSRVTRDLCRILSATRLQALMVTHVNHANEIDDELKRSFSALKHAGVTLLNQAVLLRGVNDSAESQVTLQDTLFDAGVLPYYLHLLDKVQGAAHYHVSDRRAREIMAQVMTKVSGYLVPRLTREIGGRSCKIPLDLNLA